jgi:uncharacterized protein (TIGR00106 family)
MLLAELSMSPMDQGASVSKFVARSLKIIDESGVSYRLNPMGTCIEGEYDEVMNLIKKCYETMSSDCERIAFSIKGDWRKGKTTRLNAKVEKVQKLVGKKLKT